MRIIILILFVELLLIVLHLTPVPSAQFSRAFDLDKEANVPAWFSSSQLLILALMALYAGAAEKTRLPTLRTRAWGWLALSAGFLALSIDETSQIHEHVGYIFDKYVATSAYFPGQFVWVLVIGPFLLAASLFFLRFFHVTFRERPLAWRLALLGIMCWILSFGMESLVHALFLPLDSYQLEVVLEEGLEMVGGTMLFAALGVHLGWLSDEIAHNDYRHEPSALEAAGTPLADESDV